MSHLPAIPEVILLDFLPRPGELHGIIADRLPGLAVASAPLRKTTVVQQRPHQMARSEVFILLDYIPSLMALEGVIRGHRPAAQAQPADQDIPARVR